MLNYIWAAMLIIGIGVAIINDISDNSNNKYNNGEAFIAKFISSDNDDTKMIIAKDEFLNFYGERVNEDLYLDISLSIKNDSLGSIFILINDSHPKILKTIAAANGENDDITGKVEFRNGITNGEHFGHVYLENVSFLGMKSITNAALDYAGIAVNIAIGLIGIMALWLGVMKIAEQAGLIKIIARAVKPITKFLFPEVPSDHPAIGAMVMNISANMLGLGNAATPFGLKAMEELDKLNKVKGTATNAMCTFLAVNTAGLTLIPATAIAIRAASGSNDPTIIIGTSIFGATCATITGIFAAKVFEKLSYGKTELINWFRSFKLWQIGIIALLVFVVILSIVGVLNIFENVSNALNSEGFKLVVQSVSIIAIPLFIISFVIYGLAKKVKVYESFVDGAKEGFNVAVKIIPYLVGMLVAIGIFRAGGAMEMLISVLTPITNLIGMPAEVMPMALMRPLSGSGSIGIMTELMSSHGTDSFIGVLSSTILGSTETTFYVLAVYFGSVNIRKTRHAVPVGILADIAGILGALFIVNLMFG